MRRRRPRPLLRVLVPALVIVLAATRLLVDGVPELHGWHRWAGLAAGWTMLLAAVGWLASTLVRRWRWRRAARDWNGRLKR